MSSKRHPLEANDINVKIYCKICFYYGSKNCDISGHPVLNNCCDLEEDGSYTYTQGPPVPCEGKPCHIHDHQRPKVEKND